jgi:hypothetical protein
MATNLKGFAEGGFNKIIEMQRLPAVPVGPGLLCFSNYAFGNPTRKRGTPSKFLANASGFH